MSLNKVDAHKEQMQRIEKLGMTDEVSRPLKVVFLGSGSSFFSNLFIDIINIPGACEGIMGLVDVDLERLKLSEQIGRKILRETGRNGWTIIASADREDVLADADYVVNCIEVNGTNCIRFENDIPMEYGVEQCVGDTIGPGGLFKSMRTVPVFLDILRDIERLCPDAWVLNYTNPMSIMCLAANRYSKAKVIGLCHSVQVTSHRLAEYMELPYHELEWNCGGLNHLAWFTTLKHQGKDLYPMLNEKIENDPELLAKDPVRFDFMKYFGCFVTESSRHLSEYLPYYRKRKDLIDKHCGTIKSGATGYYAANWPGKRKQRDELRRKYIKGEEQLSFNRTWEYASYIVQAMETNTPFKIHATVMNKGQIGNLPLNNVVETACLVDKSGVNPVFFGNLPTHLAAINCSHSHFYDLAAEACAFRSKELAIKAMMLDPLTAAVCAPSEIKEMTLRLFEADRDFLPGFK